MFASRRHRPRRGTRQEQNRGPDSYLPCDFALLQLSCLKSKNHFRREKLSTGGKYSPPEKPKTGISPHRLWLFRFCAAILIPLVALGGLELGLRLSSYGYSTSFFLKTKIGGVDYYVPNDQFGCRFFPRALARTPAAQRMAVKKTPNTYRIFVFGESAAMGDPDPSFGAWRYLQVLLRERFPGVNFEVICVAMTAINSNVILPIARECAGRDGDLWIIYMGNNEMVGPFGGGTVFGSRAPGTGLIRADIALKATKIGQLLDSLMQRSGAYSSMPKSWRGLDMFQKQQLQPDDPNRLRAYENFNKNLADILRAGCDAGVPIILSTVASNLKDCAPFASLHPTTMGEIQKAKWDGLFQSGISLQSIGNYNGALDQFKEAAAIDSHYAELQFRMGSCDLALKNVDRAAREFELARDDDALAFRADGRINQIIGEEARTCSGKGVHVLDAAAMLAQKSPDKIPGDEFFFEHVHLNFEGNYLLGRAFAEQTAKLLPAAVIKRSTGDWASQEFCDKRLALSSWDRYRVWQDISSRIAAPPYTAQASHAALVNLCEVKIDELKSRSDFDTNQIRQLYQQALAQSPVDGFLHWNFAEFLGEIGDLAGATREAERVCELLPQEPGQFYDVGNLLIAQDKIADAADYFSRALAVQGDFVNALDGMGLILQNEQKTNEALAYFRHALRAEPDRADTCLDLGFLEQSIGDSKQAGIYYQRAARLQPQGPADYFNQGTAAAALGFHPQAIEDFETAIRLNPDFWQAHYLLGIEFASEGNTDEAGAQFLAAVRHRPDFAMAHLNLGIMLVRQANPDQALSEFRTALQLDPGDPSALKYIDSIRTTDARDPSTVSK